MDIRAAAIDDYPALCGLYHELDEHHLVLRPDILQSVEGPARSLKDIREKLADRDCTILVAEHNHQLCGFVEILKRQSKNLPMFRKRQIALIDNIVVSRQHRRQGIATMLINATKAWAKEQKIEEIRLHVFSNNSEAVNFYDSLGFKIVTRELELKL